MPRTNDPNEVTIEELFSEAEKQYNAKNFKEALVIFNKCLALEDSVVMDRTSAQSMLLSHYYVGDILQAQGKSTAAIEHFKKFSDIHYNGKLGPLSFHAHTEDYEKKNPTQSAARIQRANFLIGLAEGKKNNLEEAHIYIERGLYSKIVVDDLYELKSEATKINDKFNDTNLLMNAMELNKQGHYEQAEKEISSNHGKGQPSPTTHYLYASLILHNHLENGLTLTPSNQHTDNFHSTLREAARYNVDHERLGVEPADSSIVKFFDDIKNQKYDLAIAKAANFPSKNPNFTIIQNCIGPLLMELSAHKNDHLLSSTNKSDLFKAICKLPEEEKIKFLEQAKSKDFQIGQRMWVQEGYSPCTENTGTLKEINKELSMLRKLHADKPDTTANQVDREQHHRQTPSNR